MQAKCHDYSLCYGTISFAESYIRILFIFIKASQIQISNEISNTSLVSTSYSNVVSLSLIFDNGLSNFYVYELSVNQSARITICTYLHTSFLHNPFIEVECIEI